MATRWLTDSIIRDLRPPERGVTSTWDAPDPRGRQGWAAGFGVRVYAGGSKSFVLRYRSKTTRVEHLYKIGAYPDWNVTAARSEARELRLKIERNGDPQIDRQQSRDAPTMAMLCDRFVAEHVPKKRTATQRDYRSICENIIKPALGRRLVAAIATKDVEGLHADITKRAPFRANRMVGTLSAMLTLAVKWHMRPDNPCKGVKLNPENKRRRYLEKDELVSLTQALAKHEDQQAANIFRLLLLTGSRKTEVLSATWDQFNFVRNVWTKPASTTKDKRPHEVPLSSAVLSLLTTMRKAASDDANFLFPSRVGRAGYRTEIKKPWVAILKRAGITGLRVHDLRHSFASELVSAGFSLAVIGNLLGHSQVATTARYAHLYDDVAREAVNRAGARMVGLVAKPPTRGKKLEVVAGGGR